MEQEVTGSSPVRHPKRKRAGQDDRPGSVSSDGDDSAIDLTVEDLVGADHILAVFDAEGANIVACGPIGAYTYTEGDDLVFGLRAQGESPYSGIVIVGGDDDKDDAEADSDTDGGLEIEIYLVNNTAAPTATPEG